MANTNYQYAMDQFNGMQANRGQHLGGQQTTAGVPEQYLGPWSTVSEQFRNSNATVGGPQAAAAGHQVSPRFLPISGCTLDLHLLKIILFLLYFSPSARHFLPVLLLGSA